MTKLGEVILRDTRANQPVAGVAGRLYYVTDESVMERDSGTTWQDVSATGATPLTVKEQDGTPTVTPVTTIKVSNGTLTDDGGGVVSLAIGGGSGTVTSVAMTVPAEFSVTGSPITTSGTLAIAKANENANTVWAGPSSGAAAQPTFRALVAADLIDALNTGAAGVLLDHFFNVPPGQTSGNSSLGFTTNASGSSAGAGPVAPPDAASLGVLDVTTGTATNGRSGVFSYNASPGLTIRFGGGVLDLTWRFYVPTLPTGGEDYELTIGFIDAVNSSHTDGAYLLLSSASANFRYITRSNSTTTNTDSGLAAVAGTWYKLRIVVNAGATAVTFTIDGGSSQSPTTNIPTGAGREVGIGAGITKSAGTTARSVYLDYARFAWSGVSA